MPSDPTKHWCGTCGQIGKVFKLASEQFQRLSEEEKAEFRRAVDRQFGIPESDTEFLRRCGIKPDA